MQGVAIVVRYGRAVVSHRISAGWHAAENWQTLEAQAQQEMQTAKAAGHLGPFVWPCSKHLAAEAIWRSPAVSEPAEAEAAIVIQYASGMYAVAHRYSAPNTASTFRWASNWEALEPQALAAWEESRQPKEEGQTIPAPAALAQQARW